VRVAGKARGQELTMLYVIGGILAAGLLIYLFVALLKPEIFS
jgi:K+-transporting ATPase KdpF subunit